MSDTTGKVRLRCLRRRSQRLNGPSMRGSSHRRSSPAKQPSSGYALALPLSCCVMPCSSIAAGCRRGSESRGDYGGSTKSKRSPNQDPVYWDMPHVRSLSSLLDLSFVGLTRCFAFGPVLYSDGEAMSTREVEMMPRACFPLCLGMKAVVSYVLSLCRGAQYHRELTNDWAPGRVDRRGRHGCRTRKRRWPL